MGQTQGNYPNDQNQNMRGGQRYPNNRGRGPRGGRGFKGNYPNRDGNQNFNKQKMPYNNQQYGNNGQMRGGYNNQNQTHH